MDSYIYEAVDFCCIIYFCALFSRSSSPYLPFFLMRLFVLRERIPSLHQQTKHRWVRPSVFCPLGDDGARRLWISCYGSMALLVLAHASSDLKSPRGCWDTFCQTPHLTADAQCLRAPQARRHWGHLLLIWMVFMFVFVFFFFLNSRICHLR